MKNISLLLIGLILCLSGITVEAKGGHGGDITYYGGGKHSSSHDDHFQGGSGSSHKGVTYKNSKTSDQYGKHKD